MFHQTHPNLHDKIIDLMKELNYPSNADGVCAGIGMMGVHAFAINDIQSFNKRIRLIASYTLPDLVAAIRDVKAELATDSQRTTPPKKLHLSEHEQDMIDVLAFLEGIELCQNPDRHQDFFNFPSRQTISSSIASPQLASQGGLHAVMSWLGIYNRNNKIDELHAYFELLHEIASSIEKSFTVTLDGTSHLIALHYDAPEAAWYLLDANQLPIRPCKTSLADEVQTALLEHGRIITFETTLYLPANATDTAEKLKNAIQLSSLFSSLHAITETKARYQSSQGVTLAFMAARNGYTDVIMALCATGVDINQSMNDGEAPFYIAAQNGHANVITVLLAAGADVNQPMNDGATPLYIAAQNGHAAMIAALLKAGANVNQPKKDGATPLFIAAQSGHASIITTLHTAGANINQPMNDGVTPAVIAVDRNHVSALIALEQAGADLIHLRFRGKTLLQFAEANNATDCAAFLKDYISKKTGSQQNRFFALSQAPHDTQDEPNIRNQAP